MNKFLALFLLLAISFSSCKKKQADVLADIKKTVTETNKNLQDLTKKQVEDLTTAMGGTITGYYRDDEIRKIYAEHFGEKSRSFSEYYFDEGMLIYAVKQEFIYNCAQSYTEEAAKSFHDSVWYDDKKTKLEISKYYFDNNKLIKWINGDNIDVPVNSPGFTDKQSAIWSEAVVLIKELKEE